MSTMSSSQTYSSTGTLTEIYPVDGPNKFELIINTIKLRKCDKDTGTSLIVAEMLKASGVERAQQIRDLIEVIIHFGKIPTEREESIIVSLYKGKDVALERGNCRNTRILDQTMKVLESAAKNFLQHQERIKQWHAVSLQAWTQDHYLCHIHCTPVTRKKVYAINKTFYMAFVGVGKTFRHAVFSPEFCAGCPWDSLYTVDLVIISEPLEELQEKLIPWKTNMEGKGLRVNIGKTKVLLSGPWPNVLQKSSKDPHAMGPKHLGPTAWPLTVLHTN